MIRIKSKEGISGNHVIAAGGPLVFSQLPYKAIRAGIDLILVSPTFVTALGMLDILNKCLMWVLMAIKELSFLCTYSVYHSCILTSVTRFQKLLVL